MRVRVRARARARVRARVRVCIATYCFFFIKDPFFVIALQQNLLLIFPLING